MYIEVLKSKIHRVTVTRANLDYIGSITVDSALMRAAGLFEGEKVSVVNVTNGNRVETYVIPGEEGSGSIVLKNLRILPGKALAVAKRAAAGQLSGEALDKLSSVAYLSGSGLLTLENGGVLGRVVARKERGAFVPAAIALSLLIVAILVITAVLGFPAPVPVSGDERPVLTIRSEGEEWGVSQDLGVFSGSICPGSNNLDDPYDLEIENPTEYEMEYTLTLTDNNSWNGRSPLEYRLKMNNVYIGETNGWTAMADTGNVISFYGIHFTPGSSHIITIEWRWPFESGNDGSDTQAGHANGIYRLNVKVSASIVGQE